MSHWELLNEILGSELNNSEFKESFKDPFVALVGGKYPDMRINGYVTVRKNSKRLSFELIKQNDDKTPWNMVINEDPKITVPVTKTLRVVLYNITQADG